MALSYAGGDGIKGISSLVFCVVDGANIGIWATYSDVKGS